MEELRKAIGFADMCELMKNAFSFPDEDLAQALTAGSFQEDMRSCLEDVEAPEELILQAETWLSPFLDKDPTEIFSTLRKDFTHFYLMPGEDMLIYPYESAFRLVKSTQKGKPSLFGSSTVHDVEARMKEAGVAPKNARTEPSDSVWTEFEFLSFLYGSLAAAYQQDDDPAVSLGRSRIDQFFESHAGRWLPAFMEETQQLEESIGRGVEYKSLALCGASILDLINRDISSMRD